MRSIQFLAELKSRGVYRVATIYAAGSWGLLQVADVLFPILGLPDWSISAVLGIAVLGFPITLVLSWLFDITPAGVVETDTLTRETPSPVLSPARIIELSLVVGLVILVGFLYFDRLDLFKPSALEKRPSIAVMPFKNLSANDDMDYFGDGLAEDTLNLLSVLTELDVAARTSSFYFKDKQIDAKELGAKLGVSHLLEGSVRRSQERVRITANLVQTDNGFHVWSETYDRGLSDILAIQEEIARNVVQKLHLHLSENSERVLAQPLTQQPRAYDYYLRGRDYLRSSVSLINISRAVDQFNKAIELDEDYGKAFAGLCDAYLEMYRLQLTPAHFESATSACDQALALEASSLPVLVARGNLYRPRESMARLSTIFARLCGSTVNLRTPCLVSPRPTLAATSLNSLKTRLRVPSARMAMIPARISPWGIFYSASDAFPSHFLTTSA